MDTEHFIVRRQEVMGRLHTGPRQGSLRLSPFRIAEDYGGPNYPSGLPVLPLGFSSAAAARSIRFAGRIAFDGPLSA